MSLATKHTAASGLLEFARQILLEAVEQLLTIGYTDHHTPTLRDRPDQRRMGNP